MLNVAAVVDGAPASWKLRITLAPAMGAPPTTGAVENAAGNVHVVSPASEAPITRVQTCQPFAKRV
jgi:hypothetical protein